MQGSSCISKSTTFYLYAKVRKFSDICKFTNDYFS
nr:MAG TPA: hypothetical protein [Caudoviricetes sp.]